ncbi:hypothetical protein IQ26_05881 [Mesorhizobium tianshanense]|uniref:Uncharacterized protein n=1 Tax=Mesorhizobium tianshanense TaxID=39844 RepID=A0A562N403_9HYPH|nr:hypothetical protein IQ26_05881 [Mesorhizobium tianshanense]
MQCHEIHAEAHDHPAIVGHSLQAPQRRYLRVAADVRHFQQESQPVTGGSMSPNQDLRLWDAGMTMG